MLIKIIIPEKYESGALLKKYGEEYFLRLYLEIRIMEMEVRLLEHERKRLIRDTINTYISGKQDLAIRTFERIIATTYSCSGSLTKRREGDTLRKEESFKKDELRDAVSTYR